MTYVKSEYYLDPTTGQRYILTRAEEAALALGPIYDDGTYKYFGEAVPGTALTAADWRVSRMTIATSQIEWCDGDALFDNVFTSLAVVELLSFS